jgi:ATP-dependent helicase/DNAse subunit B
MPLTVIKGPPNSGRTEQVRNEYEQLLARRPVLVVPSTDDIFAWERRLMGRKGAFLGARVIHFKDLVAEVLDLGPGERTAVASELMRRSVIQEALESAWPLIAERARTQPGLLSSMLDLIDEFRGALIDPTTLDFTIEEADGEYLSLIAGTYRAYLDGLTGRGLDDGPGLAMAAAKCSSFPDWEGRPVFVAGFDDLTRQQLELLTRISAVTDVTVAITHEVGNPAMAVTEKLLGSLEAAGAEVRQEFSRDDRGEHAELLFEIERRFGRQQRPDRLVPVKEEPPGEGAGESEVGERISYGLKLLTSSGQRAEAEAVAAEIARLTAAGVNPGEIAIAVDAPAVNGARFAETLTDYGIASTLECETPAATTATGQAVLNLLAASRPNGSAADLIRFLRGPVGADQHSVDRLERRILRGGIESASDAIALMPREGLSLPYEWQELVSGRADVGPIAKGLAGEIAEAMVSGRAGKPVGQTAETEAQIATAIARSCDELAEIGGGRVGREELLAALSSGAIKTWSVPARETVRIASPYSLRAKRFEYLFMVSLQERSMGSGDLSGPFLSASSRQIVGLPEFTDPEQQELYLFYSCLSVPLRGLCLSSRVADENGKAEFPSPLVAEVEKLFDESTVRLPRSGRTSSDVLFDPEAAPSSLELARSLAAIRSRTPSADFSGLSVEQAILSSITGQIEYAGDVERSTRTLASLKVGSVKEELAEIETFSATALEAFTECPFKWFIQRVISPSRFGREPEALARGSLIHGVLARIYDDRPGRIPRPGDLKEWINAAEVEVERFAVDQRLLDTDSAADRTARRQAMNSIADYLRFEAGRESPRFLPVRTEAGFGLREGDPKAVDMGKWKLRGSIDRIDASMPAGAGPDGGAPRQFGVVLDYKSGPSSFKTRAAILQGRKLQLQLYLYAMKETWHFEPAAGLYAPVFRGEDQPRGFVDSDLADLVCDLNWNRNDRKGSLDTEMKDAMAIADAAVTSIRKGEIDHDPYRCSCHFEHASVPDPRLHPSAGIEPGEASP